MPAAKPAFPTLRAGHPLAYGLVAGWPFYEGSGPSLNDLKGNGITGTLTAGGGTKPTWVGGPSGWALTQDGTGGYTALGNPTALQFTSTSAFSFAAWVNWTSGVGMVVSYGNGFAGWHLAIDNGGLGITTNGFWFQYQDNSSNFRRRWTANNSLTSGVWFHLAGTADGSNTAAGMHVYINGALADSGSQAGTPADFNYSGTDLRLGSRGTIGADELNGSYDGVAVYNYALAQEEVASLAADSWQQYRRRSWRLAPPPPANFANVWLLRA